MLLRDIPALAIMDQIFYSIFDTICIPLLIASYFLAFFTLMITVTHGRRLLSFALTFFISNYMFLKINILLIEMSL